MYWQKLVTGIRVKIKIKNNTRLRLLIRALVQSPKIQINLIELLITANNQIMSFQIATETVKLYISIQKHTPYFQLNRFACFERNKQNSYACKWKTKHVIWLQISNNRGHYVLRLDYVQRQGFSQIRCNQLIVVLRTYQHKN